MAAESRLTITINGENNTKGAFDAVTKGLQAIGQLTGSKLGMDTLKNEFNETTGASNKVENSLLGLSSVARAFTGEAGAAEKAAKDLTEDGLMTISEAATGLKNLLASGYGLEDAITIMNRFKDSAAFGRQAALGFGESIVGATEGIKNGNSLLVDNVGVTKNLSVILQEAGYSAQDMGKASSDAGVRQAILNGILRETAPQLGNAAQASHTFSGAQAELGTTVFNTRAKIGDMVKIVAGPMTTGIAAWLQQNQGLAASLGIAGAAVIGFLSVLAGAGGMIAAIGAAVAIIGGPMTIVLMGLSAVLGTVVFGAMQRLQQKMAETTKTTVDGSKAIGNNAQSGFTKASKAAADLVKQLNEIDRSMSMAERDFKESMAKMIQDHEEKRDQIKESLAKETGDYTEANNQRITDFAESQAKMNEEHQNKVRDIEDQINEETAKGAFANQERLASLVARLNDESNNYNLHYGELQKKYDEDTAKAKQAYDDKLLQLQTELNGEVALLQKHADDKKAVQGVMLLDEIDLLKRTHAEQMASYTRQRNDAIQKAAETTAGIAGQFNGLPGMINPNALSGVGSQLGNGMANALKQAFIDSWNGLWAWIRNTLKQDLKDIFSGDLGKGMAMLFSGKSPAGGGFATGTNFAPGGGAWVGENGPEYINVPRGSQVMPAKESAAMMGGNHSEISIGQIVFQNTTEGGMAEIWRQLGRGQELSIMGLAQQHG